MVGVPAVPGALNVNPVGDEIVALAGVGPQWQQATVAQIASGGSQQGGTFVLNGATPVVVPNVVVTANSIIIPTVKNAVSQGAAPTVTAIVPGVSFTVIGTAGDTSTYNYRIFG